MGAFVKIIVNAYICAELKEVERLKSREFMLMSSSLCV